MTSKERDVEKGEKLKSSHNVFRFLGACKKNSYPSRRSYRRRSLGEDQAPEDAGFGSK